MSETDQLETTEQADSQPENMLCACPDEYPDWAGQDISFAGWKVHSMPIKCFFHMPLAYDMYMSKQAESIEQLELTERWPGFVLSRTKMFGGNLLRIIEEGDSPSRLVQHLPTPFDVHVFMHNGGIGSVTKAVHQQQIDLVEMGRRPKELYMAHLTCPLCFERKGGDKIMVIRRWVSSKRMQSTVQRKPNKPLQDKVAEPTE